MAKSIVFISIFTCLIFPSACFSAASSAQSKMLEQVDYSPMQEEITTLIKQKMKKNSTVGLSIAVVDGQKLVWAKGFGWADKKNKIRAAPETVYRVGSITKLFTATAAMQLSEQGRLDIDQPLEKVLPQFSIKSHSEKSGSITPRNIMTHHSGLPTDYVRGMWAEEPEEFTHLVDLIRDEYSAYPPDTIFCYSNVAMTLLGHAVQDVSGQPYGELIEQKLLFPMGMFDSYIAQTLQKNQRSSKGYSGGRESVVLPLRDLPAGGLNSTVLDLANFAKMVFAGGRFDSQQIIKKETLDEMLHFQDGDAPFDLENQMGLGWFLEQQGDDASVFKAMHGGETFLFHSIIAILPQYELAVIVLANSESAVNLVHEIADDTLRIALEAKTGINRPTPRKLSETELPATQEDLITYPGYYSTDDGILQIVRDDNQLRLIRNDDTLNLVLRQDGQYHLKYKLFGLFSIDLEGLDELGITHAEVSGREVLIAKFRGQKMFFGEKIIPTPIPASWRSRTGSYEIINLTPGILFKNIELIIEHNYLMLRYSAQLPYQDEADETSQVTLRVTSDHDAVFHGLGSELGDTIRVVYQNGDELLSWSGFVFRRVR